MNNNILKKNTNIRNFEIVKLQKFLELYPEPDYFQVEGANNDLVQGYYLYLIGNNNVDAMWLLAQNYGFNHTGNRDRWLVDASKAGHDKASKSLLHYTEKYEKKLQPGFAEKAYEIYKAVCQSEECHPDFIDRLAMCYDKGKGTNKNDILAKELYLRGSLKNQPHCMCRIGLEYESIGEYEKAFELFRKTIELYPTYAWARCRLANMYEKGFGTTLSYNNALQLYKQSCELPGNPALALFHVGLYYEGQYHADVENFPDFPRNPADPSYIPIDRLFAFNKFLKSADLNDHRACLRVGKYFEGLEGYADVVQKDMMKAYEYYNRGASNHDGECCYKVGLFHENYPGYEGFLPIDIQEAKFFYQRGAKKGNQNCLNRLEEFS